MESGKIAALGESKEVGKEKGHLSFTAFTDSTDRVRDEKLMTSNE